jgi:D-sedoheptulose 7-phosphate isomerase
MTFDRAKEVRDHLLRSAEVKKQAAERCMESILRTADLIVETFRSGGKLLLCGNGGSAADCQHMAAELVSRLTKEVDRPGLPAVALTTDSSFLTAYSNDVGFGGVFERQVRALGKAGDVLIGISTSGNSVNLIRALEAARSMRIGTVALVGSKGRLGELADIAISIPSSNTHHIQEAHLAVEHLLCHLVESQMFGDAKNL